MPATVCRLPVIVAIRRCPSRIRCATAARAPSRGTTLPRDLDPAHRGERSQSAETQHAIYGGAAIHSKSSYLANLIAAHHAGLFDWGALEPKLREVRTDQRDVLSTCLQRFQSETSSPPPSIGPLTLTTAEQCELRTRLLLSALVDADRLDTEAHAETHAGRRSIRAPFPPLVARR